MLDHFPPPLRATRAVWFSRAATLDKDLVDYWSLIRIAYVGDDDRTGWSEISFAGETVQYLDLFNGFLICGQHVYCFDPWGTTIIYNMETDHEWKEIIEN